jgi:peroxiredoxin
MSEQAKAQSQAESQTESPEVKVGDCIPYDIEFGVLSEGEEDPHGVSAREVFQGKKVALFGIPGAYTSICSAKHLPEYIQHYNDLVAKGIDRVACTAVNDPYVLRAWAKSYPAESRIMMLADGSGKFHKRLGLLQELNFAGLRGRRFSMVVDDGTVKILNVDEVGPKSYKVSGPEKMLRDLEGIKWGKKEE